MEIIFALLIHLHLPQLTAKPQLIELIRNRTDVEVSLIPWRRQEVGIRN